MDTWKYIYNYLDLEPYTEIYRNTRVLMLKKDKNRFIWYYKDWFNNNNKTIHDSENLYLWLLNNLPAVFYEKRC